MYTCTSRCQNIPFKVKTFIQRSATQSRCVYPKAPRRDYNTCSMRKGSSSLPQSLMYNHLNAALLKPVLKRAAFFTASSHCLWVKGGNEANLASTVSAGHT